MTQHDIDCEQALRRLFDFLDHELAAPERDEMQRHLSTCRSCYSRAHFEQQLKGKLHALGTDKQDVAAGSRIEALLRQF